MKLGPQSKSVPILPRSSKKEAPRLPDGLRIYAVPDIHGTDTALVDVLARIDADEAARPAARTVQIFLGDYVDRGPASRQVLDRLIARARTHEILMLKGNHELLFRDFTNNPAILGNWGKFGGLQTLISYGLKPSLNPGPEEQRELARELELVVPPAHWQLIDQMPSSFSCGDFFFVHAGVRPGIPLSDQKDEDLLWIRQDFLLYEGELEKFVIHGHTPVKEPEIRSNRINLDTGAYATGKLTCLAIEGDSVEFI
jgi:serine/threonine protein phosphatase 1